MIDALSLAVDFALFLVTVLVVGKKPTAAKVTTIICLVAAIDYGFVAFVAMQANMTPVEWYQGMLEQAVSLYGAAPQDQAGGGSSVVSVVAGISPAIYVVQASAYVFVGLCLRWIADRVRRKSDWSPFSQVDLSIWWLIPLLFGLICLIVSLLLHGQAAYVVWLVSLNAFVVSVIPLFVQGAAAGKGIMNRLGIGFPMQLVFGVLGLASGIAFVVLPILGLVDFWANFRKLPRESMQASGGSAE